MGLVVVLLKIYMVMIMETKVSYAMAGTFVLVLLSFIILGIIWLSAGLNNKDYVYYKVYMTESISGLNKNGPVQFNGVNVGNIESMTLSRKNPQLVILLLKVEEDTPVTMGTRAKLGVKALTGAAFLLLEDKGTDMRPLKAQEGQEYPVIPAVPSILVKLDTTLTQINESFQQINASFKSVFSKKNLKWINQLLESSTGSIQVIQKQTLPAANETLTNIGDAARDISEITSDIKENPAIIIRGREQSTKLGPGEK